MGGAAGREPAGIATTLRDAPLPSAGAVVRTVLPAPGAGRTPAPACAPPAARAGHPGEPPAGCPAAAGSSRTSPAPASKRLGPPRGRGSPSAPPGAAFRDRPGGADGTGRRESSGRGRSCTPTRSGPCRPGTGPEPPSPCSSMHPADQRQGRSHSTATTSRRAPPDHPPPTPAPPVRRAPSVMAPARTPNGSRPRRAPGADPRPLRPHAFAHAPQTPPRPIRGRPGRPDANPIAHRPRSTGRFPSADTTPPTPPMDSIPPPHPGRPSSPAPASCLASLVPSPMRCKHSLGPGTGCPMPTRPHATPAHRGTSPVWAWFPVPLRNQGPTAPDHTWNDPDTGRSDSNCQHVQTDSRVVSEFTRRRRSG